MDSNRHDADCERAHSEQRVALSLRQARLSHRDGHGRRSGGSYVPNPAPVSLRRITDPDTDMGATAGDGLQGTLFGLTESETFNLANFLMDRLEVTNRQYKAFVDAGGYAKREYWDSTIVSDGQPVAWEQAMARFVDKSGRPGPSAWEGGAPFGRHEDRGVHHATIGDRPTPRAPPYPRRDGGPRRRAASALDPRTVWTGRHATTRRSSPGPLHLTPTPCPRAGTFGVRVRTTRASEQSPLRPGAQGKRRPDGQRGAAAGRPLRARRPALAWSAIAPDRSTKYNA